MLVIGRKVNESLIIEVEGQQEPIEIVVTETGYQVKLGINAPKGFKIWRKEIYPTVVANRCATDNSSVGSVKGLAEIFGKKKSE